MKLWHCNKAQIYNLQEELLCTAEVVGDVENTAKLRMEGSCEDILRTEVIVVFLDATQGMVSCMCSLSDYDETFDSVRGNVTSTVNCRILEYRGEIQRRKDVKVYTKIQAYAEFIDEEDRDENGKKGKKKFAEILILDISAGGMFCISRQQWKPKQKIALTLFRRLPVEAEILRTQLPSTYNHEMFSDRFSEEEGFSGYGCRFINLTVAAEASLRKYVFQQEVLQHKSKVQ